MKVAVLSLTRDRLDYTKRCFRSLHEFAGHPFDHYVFDNGSTDGTQHWLMKTTSTPEHVRVLVPSKTNIGVCRALNDLLHCATPRQYDLYVKFDNDCELIEPNTLKQIVELSTPKLILSPKIRGLQTVVPVYHTKGRLDLIPIMGGIFMAIPGWVFNGGWRYSESNPIWGLDDSTLGEWFQRRKGGQLAYVNDLFANHYETTDGQRKRYPEYFSRKDREFAENR